MKTLLKFLIVLVILLVIGSIHKKEVIAEHNLHCGNSIDIKEFSKCEVAKKWDDTQWSAFEYIVQKESNWDSTAQNPTSTAYGISQFLNSTWKLGSYKKTGNPQIQILAMVEYIEVRYNTPTEAFIYWQANKHY